MRCATVADPPAARSYQLRYTLNYTAEVSKVTSVQVGTMAAPMTKLVQTLNEVPSKFVRTLSAVRDSRSDEQAA